MMNEDLITRLRAIHVPTKEEALARSRDPYGLLLWDSEVLKYVDFESKRVKELLEVERCPISIATHNGDVFFDNASDKVVSLFGDFEYSTTSDTLLSHSGRLLSASSGIWDVLDNQELVSKKDLAQRRVRSIQSLFTSPSNDLYALASNNHGQNFIYSLGDDCSFQGRILEYRKWNSGENQAVTVPYGWFEAFNLKVHYFSVLSCVNEKFLDVNGEKIKGTVVGGDEKIHRLAVLKENGCEVDVIYSGDGFNSIKRARIDLKTKQVIGDVGDLVSDLSCFVFALHPVTDYTLHKRIMGYKRNEQRSYC